HLGRGDVLADLDAAEEAKALAGSRLLVDADHRLDLRVVGRDARADEAERRRKLVEEVDGDVDVVAFQQMLGRVEAGGPGTNDGHAQRVLLRADGGHGTGKGRGRLLRDSRYAIAAISRAV